MSSKARIQLFHLAEDYERESQEFSVLKKIIKIWSKEKHTQEEIIPEQIKNSDNLNVYGPSTNIGQ